MASTKQQPSDEAEQIPLTELHPKRVQKPNDEDVYHPTDRTQKVLVLILVAAFVAPIAVIPSLTDRLSRPLGERGCLPDGKFAFPGTTKAWNASQFLSINVPVTSDKNLWTFTHAKGVDIIWDLLVGRGFQLLLVFVAFRVFSKVLLRIMEGEPVPFRTYSDVNFKPGSLGSGISLLRVLKKPTALASDEEPAKRSTQARVAVVVMVLLTLYIAAVPTLLSSMSGYYAVAYPSLGYWPTDSIPTTFLPNNHTEAPCDVDPVGLLPAWGYISDALRVHSSPDFMVFPYPPSLWYSDFEQYYLNYSSEYQKMATDPACADAQNTSQCSATDISSTFFNMDLDPPLLNIKLLAPFNTTSSNTSYSPSPENMPSAWRCGNGLFYHFDFFPGFDFGANFANVTAECNLGTHYRWGFSFLLLFIVSLLTFISAILFFALWIYGNADSQGTRRSQERPTTIRAAADIVGQARQIYGDAAVDGTWNAQKMERRIYGGKVGMRFSGVERETSVRRSWFRIGHRRKGVKEGLLESAG